MFSITDPDATTEVEIAGATFTIGRLPMGLYRRMLLEDLRNQEDTRRRILRQAAKDGEKLEAEEVERRLLLDPEYRIAADRLGLQQIRWSVKGHRGLGFGDGREVPFDTEADRYEGTEHKVVSAATMRVYEANFVALVNPLIEAIGAFNTLSDQEKKASQGPSSSTEANTSAETVPAHPH